MARDRSAENAAELYYAALEDAPPRRSVARDEIIANGGRYVRNFPFTDRIVELSPEFRCGHPEEIIDQAEADGWSLIDCEYQEPTFVRAREGSSSCGNVASVLDDYDVLTITIGEWIWRNRSPQSSFEFSMRVDRVLNASTLLVATERDEALTALGWDVPTAVEIHRHQVSFVSPYQLVNRERLAHIRARPATDPRCAEQEITASAAVAAIRIYGRMGSYQEIMATIESALGYVELTSDTPSS